MLNGYHSARIDARAGAHVLNEYRRSRDALLNLGARLNNIGRDKAAVVIAYVIVAKIVNDDVNNGTSIDPRRGASPARGRHASRVDRLSILSTCMQSSVRWIFSSAQAIELDWPRGLHAVGSRGDSSFSKAPGPKTWAGYVVEYPYCASSPGDERRNVGSHGVGSSGKLTA